MTNDVSRAYMHADCEGDIYAVSRDEDQEAVEGKTMCGKLAQSMRWTRPAAKMWQKGGTKTLGDAGFKADKTPPCILYHASRDITTFLHGGDFVSPGS